MVSRFGILGPDGEPYYSGWQTGPVAPEPDPPGIFTKGHQVRRYNVGRPDGFYDQDGRTPLQAPTNQGFTSYGAGDDGRVVENVRFISNVRFTAPIDITFRYCFFDSPAGTTGYAIQNNGGARVVVEDSTSAGKYGRGKTWLLQGAGGGFWFKRCLLLGSEDVIHSTSAGTMAWPTYVGEDFTGARIIAEDCWIGDGVRATDGHVDVFQQDSHGGDVIFKRCNFQSYSMNSPSAPRTSQGDPLNPGNGCVLLTYGNSGTFLTKFGFYDCHFDGGNYAISAAPPDGPAPQVCAIRRCTFGATDPAVSYNGDTYRGVYRFGTIRGGTAKTDNSWYWAGSTPGQAGNVLILGNKGNPTAHAVTAGGALTV